MEFREQLALDRYRKRLQKCKDELKKTEEGLEHQEINEQDEYRKTILNLIIKYGKFVDDLYSQIEIWSKAQIALKSQIELLRDILIQLPDIKYNHEIMKDVQKMFKEYNKSF